jgi:hypothetical protein
VIGRLPFVTRDVPVQVLLWIRAGCLVSQALSPVHRKRGRRFFCGPSLIFSFYASRNFG